MSFLFIPIPISKSEEETEVCPSCKKEEDVIVTCRNCGYVYPEPNDEGSSGWSVVFLFIVIILFIFLIFLFMSWSIDHTSSYEPYQGTFIQFLGDKFKSFVNLLKDIW